MKKHTILFTLLAVLMIIGCFTTACQPVATNAIEPTPIPTPALAPAPTSIKKLSHIEQVGHVNKVVSTETENVSIKFDADVKISDSKTFPIVELVPKKITQEQVDNFLDTCFPEREDITTWLYDDNGNLLIENELKQAIKERETWIKNSKKNISKEAAKRSPNIAKWEKQITQYKKALKDKRQCKFEPTQESSISFTDNPEYNKWVQLKLFKEKLNNTKHIQYFFNYNNAVYGVRANQSDEPTSNSFYMYRLDKIFSSYISDSIAENYEDIPTLKTTYSQAKELVDKALNALGVDGMDLYKSSLYKSEYENPNEEFYYFVYTWDVEGTNVTYIGNSYAQCYNYFSVLIDDSGIVMVKYNEPMKYKKTFPKKVEFLPFESIMSKACDRFDSDEYLYNRFMYKDMGELKVNKYNLVIEKIELGYMLVKGYGDGRKNYTLIPVWDFFGYEDGELETTSHKRNKTSTGSLIDSYSTHKSLLTINAINGQIIDRCDNYWRN